MSKINASYLSVFCVEMAQLLGAGISVADSLLLLSEEEVTSDEKVLLTQMHDQAEMGDPLFIILEKQPAFPDYMVKMVKLGETTGRLEDVMRALAEYYRKQEQVRKTVKNAIVYPSILVIMMLSVIIILLTTVMPIFENVFAQLGTEMNTTAKVLMKIGTGISKYSVFIALGLVVIGVLVFLAYKIPALHEKIWLPIAKKANNGKIGATLARQRFSNALSMGLSSGLDIDESLKIADELCASEKMHAQIEVLKERMDSGMGFGEALGRGEIFLPRDARLISVGVRTGTTDQVMAEIAAHYEEEATDLIQGTISKIEPTLVIAMSIVVGLILLSVMLPLVSIMSTIG